MKFITSCYFRKKVSKIFKSNVALSFPPIHVDNCHIKSPEAFKCIYSINLSSSSIYDVSILRKISVIDLSWTAVEDVSALSHAHTLNLYSTEVKDVSMLGSVHKLNLGYTKVADVSALGSVHTLILRNTEVTDVSALTKVHTLDLHETKVTDISNLINVYDLDLSFTYELRDFKPIANFKKLRILNLTNSRISDYEDISFLSFVYSLNLTYTIYKGLSRNIVHKDPMFMFK
jgi:Leucine-rich repeat (LRR) protein